MRCAADTKTSIRGMLIERAASYYCFDLMFHNFWFHFVSSFGTSELSTTFVFHYDNDGDVDVFVAAASADAYVDLSVVLCASKRAFAQ